MNIYSINSAILLLLIALNSYIIKLRLKTILSTLNNIKPMLVWNFDVSNVKNYALLHWWKSAHIISNATKRKKERKKASKKENEKIMSK